MGTPCPSCSAPALAPSIVGSLNAPSLPVLWRSRGLHFLHDTGLPPEQVLQETQVEPTAFVQAALRSSGMSLTLHSLGQESH